MKKYTRSYNSIPKNTNQKGSKFVDILVVIFVIIVISLAITFLDEMKSYTNYVKEVNNTITTEIIPTPQVIVEESPEYDFDKLTCPEDLFLQMDSIAEKHGLPTEIWYPIAGYESNFNKNTRAVTDKEDSRGLFQVNTYAHTSADKLKLYEIEYNCEWQMPVLSKVYLDGLNNGLSGVELVKYVSKYGQKPDWDNRNNVTYIVNSIEKYYNELEAAKL